MFRRNQQRQRATTSTSSIFTSWQPRFNKFKCFRALMLLCCLGITILQQFSLHFKTSAKYTYYGYQAEDSQLLASSDLFIYQHEEQEHRTQEKVVKDVLKDSSPFILRGHSQLSMSMNMNDEIRGGADINTRPGDDSQIMREHLDVMGDTDEYEPSLPRRPVVDVLTISSIERPEIVEAQRSTWGSHPTIRNFIKVNEKDDPDPECRLKYKETFLVDQYVDHCKRKNSSWPSRNNITEHFTSNFARKEWLHKKKNPGGWLCAQRRMAMGLAMLRAKYEKEAIPDFLVLTDDDMYLNMDLLEVDLKSLLSKTTKSKTTTHTNTNTTSLLEQTILKGGEIMEAGADPDAKVYAGCLVLSAPAQLTQFTFPFGGWGTFFTKGAIERLIQPLQCSTDVSAPRSSFEEGACSRLVGGLDLDLLSESLYFRDGMSISDVIGALASDTTIPYCMHSDWAVAYFVNFYNISGVRWEGPDADTSHGRSWWYPDVPQTRIFPLGGGQKSWLYRKGAGNCQMTGDNCNNSSLVCHYVSETQMKRIHEEVKRVYG